MICFLNKLFTFSGIMPAKVTYYDPIRRLWMRFTSAKKMRAYLNKLKQSEEKQLEYLRQMPKNFNLE